MVPMIAWLLLVADSATSQMCLVLAALLLALGRARSVAEAPGRALALTLTAAAAAGILESVFGLSARVLQLLGRDPSLTSRVPIWTGLIQSAGNPVLGTGYESFWLGHRLLLLLEAYGVRQAHNGFVETYLNLGFVGLFLMLAIFLSGMRKAWRQLEVDLPRGLLRLTLILVVFAYNWTEATLYGLSNMWLLLLLGSLEAPDRQAVLVPERRTGRGTPPGLALPGALRSRS
jgi:O-antigen ligase